MHCNGRLSRQGARLVASVEEKGKILFNFKLFSSCSCFGRPCCHTSYLSQISQMRYVEKNLSCGEISDLYALEMWRNLKFLYMWSNFKFLHMTDVEKFEVSPGLACV